MGRKKGDGVTGETIRRRQIPQKSCLRPFPESASSFREAARRRSGDERKGEGKEASTIAMGESERLSREVHLSQKENRSFQCEKAYPKQRREKKNEEDELSADSLRIRKKEGGIPNLELLSNHLLQFIRQANGFLKKEE